MWYTCPRKGLMDFRRERLREHHPLFTISLDFPVPLLGAAVGDAMLDHGFDLTTHISTVSCQT